MDNKELEDLKEENKKLRELNKLLSERLIKLEMKLFTEKSFQELKNSVLEIFERSF